MPPGAAAAEGPPSSYARALAYHTRMRAGFPHHRPRNPTRAGDRPPRYGEKMVLHRSARACRSGSSEVLAYLPNDPDLFVIRRSQITERRTKKTSFVLLGPSDLKRHLLTMEIARETRSDARMASEGPVLREHRDPRSRLPAIARGACQRDVERIMKHSHIKYEDS